MSGTGSSAQVISCVQTRVDGLKPATRSAIPEGANWRWFGPVLRIDNTSQALMLPPDPDFVFMRERARNTIAKLGRARGARRPSAVAFDDGELTPGLIVSDGTTRWSARPVYRSNGETLLVFEGQLPPSGRDLTVVQGIDAGRTPRDDRATICFTPGTMIETPDGPRAVENLYPGDRVSTRDDGAQPIQWMGLRQVSGARMFAFPELRPVRIRAGALGGENPQPDLVVSPDHRVMMRGPKCRALWGEDEVLVRARDLIDDRAILTDHAATETVYVHLMFDRHQIVRANGVETESFHPGAADLAHLDPVEREELLECTPGIDTDPTAYGAPARRCLTAAEYAILCHGAPGRLI